MSKTLSDFADEEIKTWTEHPITLAIVAKMTGHRDGQAKAFMGQIGTLAENVIRDAGGYYRGLTDAILMMGGDK
jgi:hypothetical protein